MIRELEMIVIVQDFPELGLEAGDVGTVVHVHADGSAYEVEFVAADGDTIAVLTLEAKDVRPLAGREILHVRRLASA